MPGSPLRDEPLMMVNPRGQLMVSFRLNPDPALVGLAREQARKALPGWGLGEHADLAELVVSEMVSNAIVHGDGQIDVRLSYSCGDLRAEVHDAGSGRPARRLTTPDDERGRGLELIDGLIALHGGERGVTEDRHGPGKTVYVVLALDSGQAGAW
jgi:anti-sigma regulatory factor (Ser/Thr protein kinase)